MDVERSCLQPRRPLGSKDGPRTGASSRHCPRRYGKLSSPLGADKLLGRRFSLCSQGPGQQQGGGRFPPCCWRGKATRAASCCSGGMLRHTAATTGCDVLPHLRNLLFPSPSSSKSSLENRSKKVFTDQAVSPSQVTLPSVPTGMIREKKMYVTPGVTWNNPPRLKGVSFTRLAGTERGNSWNQSPLGAPTAPQPPTPKDPLWISPQRLAAQRAAPAARGTRRQPPEGARPARAWRLAAVSKQEKGKTLQELKFRPVTRVAGSRAGSVTVCSDGSKPRLSRAVWEGRGKAFHQTPSGPDSGCGEAARQRAGGTCSAGGAEHQHMGGQGEI